MGRRIGAYLLGLLIAAIVVSGLTAAIVFGALRPWTHHTAFGNAKSICSFYNNNGNHGDRTCVSVGDNEYYIVHTNPIVATFFVVYAGWFIIDAVIIEGLAGGKVAKLMLGLRVVRHDGRLVGMPRALLRNILLIIPDQIVVGLVGLVTALVTRGHKRVGDMAAGTYVVDRAMVGHEIVINGAPPGEYTPPRPYAAPPTQPGAGTWGQPPWGQQQPPAQPQQPPAPTPWAPGGAQPTAEPGTPSPTPSPTPESPPRREPVWDQARNTYLWWDDDKHEWLEHDPQSGQWRPLSR